MKSTVITEVGGEGNIWLLSGNKQQSLTDN